jgi:hypothetical protein
MIRDGLTRYDLPGRRGDVSGHDGAAASPRPVEQLRFGTPPRPVRAPVLDDKPAGGAPGRRRGFLGRLDRRTRSILTGAAVAAVIVNAGAVWAYWHITGSTTAQADADTVFELNLRGRSDLNKPLTPGGTGDLTVTVTNDSDFPIRIISLSPGTDKAVADVEHRENGCVDSGVTVAQQAVKVQWDVARNDVAAFTVPGGLTMAGSADPACAGAIFTVPVLVKAVSGVS